MKRINDPNKADPALQEHQQRLERARQVEQRFREWEKERALENTNFEGELKVIKEAHRQVRDELSRASKSGRRR